MGTTRSGQTKVLSSLPGTETFVASSVGRAYQLYNCDKLSLQVPHDVSFTVGFIVVMRY
jgi:hypothetical protein